MPTATATGAEAVIATHWPIDDFWATQLWATLAPASAPALPLMPPWAPPSRQLQTIGRTDASDSVFRRIKGSRPDGPPWQAAPHVQHLVCYRR